MVTSADCSLLGYRPALSGPHSHSRPASKTQPAESGISDLRREASLWRNYFALVSGTLVWSLGLRDNPCTHLLVLHEDQLPEADEQLKNDGGCSACWTGTKVEER
jgi:hypothetical protein